jgi:GDP-mannose 6-dehydrogenase
MAVMKLTVLGLGYVGAVSAGCLAQQGHEVIGVDPESSKVDLIAAYQALWCAARDLPAPQGAEVR